MAMTETRLRELYGAPTARAAVKKLTRLEPQSRMFIAASPFVVLATSDGTRLDCSPKGDPAGFVAVEDDRHLILPDRPGNNLIDGLLNLLANPQVALIFLIPGVDETLRVNGRAEILDDTALCAAHAINARAPKTVTRIAVEEVFLHCGKAPLRAGLWRPESWADERPVPSLFEMLKAQVEVDIEDPSQDFVDRLYSETLY